MKQKENTHSDTAQHSNVENWKAVFNSVSDLIIILDADNRILDANPAVFEALGLNEDRVLGQRCYTLFHCTEKPACDCPYEKLKKSHHQESVTMEMEALGRKYLVTVSPIKDDESGQLNRVVHISKDITELKRTETALDVSEKKFQTIFQAASDGILVADLVSKKFVDANEAICEMLGYTRDELLQLHVGDIHPEKDLPQVIEAFENQAKGKLVVASQLPVKRQDGSVFYADISSKPVTLGGQDFLIGIFRDVSFRIQDEQALMAEKDKAQKYLDIAGVMLTVLNTEGIITLINQKGCEVLRVTEDEALGKNWFEHYLPERMVDEVKRVFDQIMAGDVELFEYYENPVLDSDGNERIVAFHNTILQDAEGNIAGVLFSGDDITDHKRAIESIEAQKSFFQDAIDAQIDTFFVFDPSTGKALQWNKAFENISGYSSEEISSLEAPASYYSKEDLEKAGHYIEHILQGGSGTVELELICKDGHRVITEYSASFISKTAENTSIVIAVGRDVTERKRAEADKIELENKLLQAQKMESVGRLAGGIAHDFNNILTAILGYGEMGLHEVPDGSPLRKKLEIIIESGKRASKLTGQLLAFSRQQVMDMKIVNPADLIYNLTNMMRRLIAENIHFETNITPVKNILADPGQIEQVIMNLTVNARDAMPRGGRLVIETAGYDIKPGETGHPKEMPVGGYVKITIRDTGTGINPKNIDYIFEPFFTTKELGQGTGLGLATVYGIIKQHKGFIYVDSKVDQGTTFTVFLPVVQRDKPEMLESATKSLPRGNETILVVEDEENVLNLLIDILGPLGYELLKARNGEDALNLSREHKGRLDLLLTDVIMPGMNGKELAEKLLKQWPEMKTVYISGYTDEIISHQGAVDPGITLINKPINNSRLAVIIRNVLDDSFDE